MMSERESMLSSYMAYFIPSFKRQTELLMLATFSCDCADEWLEVLEALVAEEITEVRK